MVLSPAREISPENECGGNSAARKDEARGFAGAPLAQKWLLKVQLKRGKHAFAAGEDGAHVFDRLQQCVGVTAGGRAAFAVQAGAHDIKALAQAASEPVERRCGEGRAQRLRG